MPKTWLALVSWLVLLTPLAGCSPSSAKERIPVVVLKTSLGEIEIALEAEKAPVSVENFLAYVDTKHYDGTIFHRVIPNFMVQCGGFTESMAQKGTKAPIKNEADNGLKNTRGSIAMARTRDPHSASAQFFINVVDNAALDHKAPDVSGWGYAVFGHVVEGMDVVGKIRTQATGVQSGFRDVPKKTITITRAVVATP